MIPGKKGKTIFCLCLLLVTAIPVLSRPNGVDVVLAGEQTRLTFYYPLQDASGLGAIEQDVAVDGPLSDKLGGMLEAYMKGMSGQPPNPFLGGIRLRQVFVDRNNLAYLDLTKVGTGRDIGVVEERLGLWGLVNTICMNMEDIQGVKFLVGGEEADTVFGHIDITLPLTPDPRLLESTTD